MKLRLRDPLGIFYDPETCLRIRMNQVVDVTDMGRLTRDWLNSGGLVIVKDKPEKTVLSQAVATAYDSAAHEGGELPVLVVPPPLLAEKDPKPARRKRRNTRKI